MGLRFAQAAGVLGCLALAACVEHTSVTHVPAAAPQTAWDRQIHNAKDAGDGDWELRQLREKVAADPDGIPIRLELVKAYQQRGNSDVALELCRLMAARFPDSGDVQLALVRSLRDLNRRADAIAGLDAFLKAHPQSAPSYFSWLGILQDEMGAWAAGEPAHRKALELGPSQDYLHNNLGYNLLMQKKYDEAAAEFRQALKLDPASQVARNNLGTALAHLDASKEAVASWQTGADPATAHNNLAAVLIEQGKYPEARKELELALSFNKSLPAALKNLELVSRLDGNAATFSAKPADSRWDRWKAGFLKFFVGPLEDSRTEPAKTASASQTGEER
jgi:tetratricopeptide (TPR) repeat protein